MSRVGMWGEGWRGEGFTPSPPQRGEEETQTRSGEWAGGLTRGAMRRAAGGCAGLYGARWLPPPPPPPASIQYAGPRTL